MKAIIIAALIACASPAMAQGPAIILTPNPGAITFRIGGAPADWIPPYAITVNAQGGPWTILTGTPWVQAYVKNATLYLTLNRQAWSLGPGMRHCATLAIQSFQLDEAGAPTTKIAAAQRVNVCVVRS